MITLTNQLDNTVVVNLNNVEMLQLCNLNESDDFTRPANYNKLYDRPAVRIHFASGQSLVVQECLREIREANDASNV